jgi:sugar phosphate isomerase/epimerase
MQGRLTKSIDGKIQFFPVLDWQLEFSKLNMLGISNMEWTFDQENLFQNPILTKIGRIQVRNLMEEFNVSISTATCDNLMNAPLHRIGPDGQTSMHELEIFISQIANTTISILVWPLVDAGSIKNLKEWEFFKEVLMKLSKMLVANGIKIAFETDLSPIKNFEFLEGLPEETYGLNLDIGNSACYGFSLIDDWELNKKRIINIHIKDRPLNNATVELGQGAVNWTDAKFILDEYSGLMTLQAARINSLSEIETVKKYIDFLKLKAII